MRGLCLRSSPSNIIVTLADDGGNYWPKNVVCMTNNTQSFILSYYSDNR